MGDPGRRSRAWGVLAVALALMALVTALSSATGRSGPTRPKVALDGAGPGQIKTTNQGNQKNDSTPHTNEHPGAPAPSDGSVAKRGIEMRVHSAARTASGRPAAGSSGAVHTGGGQQPGIFATSVVVSNQTVESEGDAATGTDASESSPATSTTSPPRRSSPRPGSGSPRPTTSSKPAAGTSTSRSGHAPSAGTYPGHGAIDGPSTTATFAATGGGTITAQATWTGTSTLELDITCPGGVSSSRTGSSPLSLEVADGHGEGECTVTLALPPRVHADVSYTLVISPVP